MGKTHEEFRNEVIEMRQGHSVQTVADFYGLNVWHISELENKPEFVLSKAHRHRLKLRLEDYPPRITIYTEWNAGKIFGKLKSGLTVDQFLDLCGHMHEYWERGTIPKEVRDV